MNSLSRMLTATGSVLVVCVVLALACLTFRLTRSGKNRNAIDREIH
jgi:hypothetical protein